MVEAADLMESVEGRLLSNWTQGQVQALTIIGDMQSNSTNSCCSCYNGAKDGSVGGEEHIEALRKGEVCSKCMVQIFLSKGDVAIFM